MSNNYIYVGFTLAANDEAGVGPVEACAILDEYMDDILAREREWNVADHVRLWDDEGEPLDTDTERSMVRDFLHSAIYRVMYFEGDSEEKIGNTGRVYRQQGSYDEAFEGYREISALLNVVALFDDLAKRTGILGWGIITD